MTLSRRRFLSLLAALPFVRWRQSARVEAFLQQMTLRQKVGQLFLFSSGGTTFTEEMRQLISDYHAGGMTLFSYNIGTPEQLTELTNAMQRAALESGMPIPLFIAADQEGGRVSRLQRPPFSAFPNPMALGAADDPDLTFRVAAAIAEEMAACGLNMNLAPVLDVNTQARNPVINVRAFGGDAERVAAQGKAFIEGTQSRGVVATGKHFPGHGDTVTDSHYTLPIVTEAPGGLARDMLPFQEGIAAGVGSIMTAHIIYQALDSAPATFSPVIMTDLLRGQMGFGGVVMSDALTMGAVSEARERPIYALRDALVAGVDVLTYGAMPGGTTPGLQTQLEAVEAVTALVQSGLVEPRLIDAAARRVLTLKEAFGLLDWQAQNPQTVQERLFSLQHHALLTEAANRAITLFSDGNGLLPLASDQAIALLYPREIPLISDALRVGFADVLPLPFALAPSPAEIESISGQLGGRVVVCVTLDTYRYPAQANLVNALPTERLIVVAAQSPYDLLDFPQVQSYLMSYGYSAYALAALLAVLLGQQAALGNNPVVL